MRTVKIILGAAVLVLALVTFWQIGSWELANIQLQEENAGYGTGFRMSDSIPVEV
jgi:hypothetical protein